MGGDRKSTEAKAERNGDQVDNISLNHGTQSTYLLARLDRDHPALAARVRNHDLTAHAAAIEAGFRIRTHIIPHDLARAAAALQRFFTATECRKLAELLGSEHT